MFVSQFKRVMQWLLRIFFAASIGFQVPIQKFGSWTVILQGLAFTIALLGKVAVGFMVPNFSPGKRFKGLHLRDCLVVGCSMAAEGEFAFIIAVFAVTNGMTSPELYASVVLAVLLSTIIAPFLLRWTISHFNKQIESTVYGTSHDEDAALEQGIREKSAVFWCIQTKSAPAWGLQMRIMRELNSLKLDVIDHRSWHPRHSNETDVLVNEVYVSDVEENVGNLDDLEREKQIGKRSYVITQAIYGAIGQGDAIVRVKRWIPEIPERVDDDHSVSDHLIRVTGSRLEDSMKKLDADRMKNDPDEEDYVMMEDPQQAALATSEARRLYPSRQISHLDARFTGRLEGLFRHDYQAPGNQIYAVASEEGIELLDVHGVGTGGAEARELYDVHGVSLA
jgi:hypothetical protein